MILEGIVTTMGPEGELNIAPMGPKVEADSRRFVLRPFATSTTYRNLKATGEGVLHVTDDVLLLARSAIGCVPETDVATRPADVVRGRVLLDSCRYHEFRVVACDDSAERATMVVETVAEGRLRDFFGFNRAKHAVIEAAILATRAAFLPLPEIVAEYRKLALIVAKTGGSAEQAALTLLQDYVNTEARRQGLDLDSGPPRS